MKPLFYCSATESPRPVFAPRLPMWGQRTPRKTKKRLKAAGLWPMWFVHWKPTITAICGLDGGQVILDELGGWP